jgi:hypothetical protein
MNINRHQKSRALQNKKGVVALTGPLPTMGYSAGTKPSESVIRKETIAASSSALRPRSPSRQHVWAQALPPRGRLDPASLDLARRVMPRQALN